MAIQTIKMDLLKIDKGIICQQVNCMNRYGAGLSGRIAKRYPCVEEAYHKKFNTVKYSEYLFGSHDCIQVTDSLVVANIYSQMYYGNAYKTNKRYTDESALVKGILNVATELQDVVYIPYKIGCGLGGGDWPKVLDLLMKYFYPHPELDLYICNPKL